ncbi:hypothetical protein HY478_04135 [Candidatus Uhrbacteria bacterium]|nr:hypothetical protein [Candidatus Uhrbacteria bacterium]
MRTVASIAAAAALAGIANAAAIHSPILGTGAMSVLFLASGFVYGSFFFPDTGRIVRTVIGMLLTTAWIQILGSIFYYIGKLDLLAVSVTLLSIPILTVLMQRGRRPHPRAASEAERAWIAVPTTDESDRVVGTRERGRGAVRNLAGVSNVARGWGGVLISTSAAFVIFVGLAFRMLGRAGTFESIRSPWEVLPWQFFTLIFLAALALIVLALTRSRITIPAACFFIFLCYSITVFVYPNGYGFDPFIHQATETYIAEHGTITPKPFFYVGQYAPVVIMHQVTGAPIELIDRMLLPRILALMLPLAGWFALQSPLAVALLALLPFSTFAATTPQGLANALAIITMLLALGSTSRRNTLALWILGIATVLTHPIAGVPLLFFLFIFTLMRGRESQESRDHPRAGFEAGAGMVPSPDFVETRRAEAETLRATRWGARGKRESVAGLLIFCATILGSLALPLLFYLYGFATGRGSSLRPDALGRLPQVLGELFGSVGSLETRFKPLLDFVYLYGTNLTPLLLLVAGITTVVLLRRRNIRALAFPLAAFVSFMNAVLLLAAIDFSFLPLYEQSGYAERLLDLARLFLFPLFLIGLVWGVEKVIQKSTRIVRAGAVALLAGLLTASLYLTYPHHDAYGIEHGWSVGRADIEAVRSINNDAALEPFIVLANQAVSAAALREFGFKQYYQFTAEGGRTETVFYYPIPTGAPLYDYFLRMSYDSPRRTTIAEAMDRAGVTLGYFVMNRYWTDSEKIIERAKREADEWWEIEGGKVYVFRFAK